jgi:hypothetical protein
MCRDLATGDDLRALEAEADGRPLEADANVNVNAKANGRLHLPRLQHLRIAQRALQRDALDSVGVRFVDHEFDSGNSTPVLAVIGLDAG